MTVTPVSCTKRSSDCAVGTLEFEFKEDSCNGRVSDWLRKICFTKCHHENKFYAANQKPNRYDYPP